MIIPNAADILALHERAISESGGSFGVRDIGAFESAVAQPSMTYGGQDLYPDLLSKATALCYSLAMNHAFIDGNKRIAHVALEYILYLNGYELSASEYEQEIAIMALADGNMSRQELEHWIERNTGPILDNSASSD